MTTTYEERATMEAQGKLAESEAKRISAEAELTKQRAVLAANPEALRAMMVGTAAGFDDSRKEDHSHEINMLRARNEGPGWIPRISAALMFGATLMAFCLLPTTQDYRAYWLLPILIASSLTVLLLNRGRK